MESHVHKILRVQRNEIHLTLDVEMIGFEDLRQALLSDPSCPVLIFRSAKP